MTMTLDTPAATQTKTAQARFNAALKTVRSLGFKTKMDYSSCCRSCADLGTDPYIAMYGGQDNGYGWVEGTMYKRSAIARVRRYSRTPAAYQMDSRELVKDIYLEFNDINAAEAASFAFKAEGFTVDWDGTDAKCVVIKMA